MLKITIVTSCYNSGQFIKRLYDSIVAQSYSRLEWIVVDDCSADGTFKLLNDFKRESEICIRVFKTQFNSLGGLSRYIGIAAASGDVTILIDHDDELLEGGLFTISRIWESYNSAGSINSMFFRSLTSTGQLVGKRVPFGTVCTTSKMSNFYRNPMDGLLVHNTAMLKRYYTERASSSVGLAGVIWWRMSKNSPFFYAGDVAVLIYHKDNPNSLTNSPRLTHRVLYAYAEMINQFDFWSLSNMWRYMRIYPTYIRFYDLYNGRAVRAHRLLRNPLMRLIFPVIWVVHLFHKRLWSDRYADVQIVRNSEMERRSEPFA